LAEIEVREVAEVADPFDQIASACEALRDCARQMRRHTEWKPDYAKAVLRWAADMVYILQAAHRQVAWLVSATEFDRRDLLACARTLHAAALAYAGLGTDEDEGWERFLLHRERRSQSELSETADEVLVLARHFRHLDEAADCFGRTFVEIQRVSALGREGSLPDLLQEFSAEPELMSKRRISAWIRSRVLGLSDVAREMARQVRERLAEESDDCVSLSHASDYLGGLREWLAAVMAPLDHFILEFDRDASFFHGCSGDSGLHLDRAAALAQRLLEVFKYQDDRPDTPAGMASLP